MIPSSSATEPQCVKQHTCTRAPRLNGLGKDALGPASDSILAQERLLDRVRVAVPSGISGTKPHTFVASVERHKKTACVASYQDSHCFTGSLGWVMINPGDARAVHLGLGVEQHHVRHLEEPQRQRHALARVLHRLQQPCQSTRTTRKSAPALTCQHPVASPGGGGIANTVLGDARVRKACPPFAAGRPGRAQQRPAGPGGGEGGRGAGPAAWRRGTAGSTSSAGWRSPRPSAASSICRHHA